MLAGISVDYVVRLEQARGPQPSEQVLTALCRALRLDTDERDHVFHLAGTAPPHSGQIDLHVRPSVLRLIDRFHDLPALVTSAKGDVLAWNAMSSALHGDWSTAAAGAAQPAAAPVPARPDRPAPQHGRRYAGRARRDRGADRGQPPRRWRAATPTTRAWPGCSRSSTRARRSSASSGPSTDAGGWRSHTKTVTHPTLGELTLECDTLHVPDVDQSLIVYSAAPGSHEAEALALLRVVGTQDLSHGPLSSREPPQRRRGGRPAVRLGHGSSSRTASAAATGRPALGGRPARRRRRPGWGAAGRRPAAPAAGTRACRPDRRPAAPACAATPKSASSRCGRTPRAEQEVGRLDVAVDHAAGVDRGQGVEQLRRAGAPTSGAGQRAARARAGRAASRRGTSSMAISATSSSAAQPSGASTCGCVDRCACSRTNRSSASASPPRSTFAATYRRGPQVARPVHRAGGRRGRSPRAGRSVRRREADGGARRGT